MHIPAGVNRSTTHSSPTLWPLWHFFVCSTSVILTSYRIVPHNMFVSPQTGKRARNKPGPIHTMEKHHPRHIAGLSKTSQRRALSDQFLESHWPTTNGMSWGAGADDAQWNLGNCCRGFATTPWLSTPDPISTPDMKTPPAMPPQRYRWRILAVEQRDPSVGRQVIFPSCDRI